MVRCGPSSLRFGHGEPAAGSVCRAAPGLEGRASPEDCSGCVSADSRGSGDTQGLRDHRRAELCHQLHDGCQSDPETARQDEVSENVKWEGECIEVFGGNCKAVLPHPQKNLKNGEIELETQ